MTPYQYLASQAVRQEVRGEYRRAARLWLRAMPLAPAPRFQAWAQRRAQTCYDRLFSPGLPLRA